MTPEPGPLGGLGTSVSVLTPSYNQARWLPDNLRSVAAQDYPGIEHIVIDGGSTDGSKEILAAASPAVIWESGPDRGQSDAINRAFRLSSGQILGWLNSDDAYYRADVVSRVVRVFEEYPDVGVVFGHAALVNGDNLLLHVLWSPPFAPRLLRAYNFIWQPTVFVRRSALGRADFVDEAFDYAMDLELMLHMAGRTRFKRVNSIMSIDRHHLARKSLTRPDLWARDQARLASTYGAASIAKNRVLAKAAKVCMRLAGLSELREVRRGSDVISLMPCSTRQIAFRQVAQLRRWMPSGDVAQPSEGKR